MKKLTYQWEQLRYKFLRFLCRKVAKNPLGTIRPKWVQFIYSILFPFKSMYERQANIKYNILNEVYTIEGVDISRSFIEAFKYCSENEYAIKIIKNELGLFQIKILDHLNIFSDERGRK